MTAFRKAWLSGIVKERIPAPFAPAVSQAWTRGYTAHIVHFLSTTLAAGRL